MINTLWQIMVLNLDWLWRDIFFYYSDKLKLLDVPSSYFLFILKCKQFQVNSFHTEILLRSLNIVLDWEKIPNLLLYPTGSFWLVCYFFPPRNFVCGGGGGGGLENLRVLSTCNTRMKMVNCIEAPDVLVLTIHILILSSPITLTKGFSSYTNNFVLQFFFKKVGEKIVNKKWNLRSLKFKIAYHLTKFYYRYDRSLWPHEEVQKSRFIGIFFILNPI